MNILIPAWRSDVFGGAETFIRDLALGLARRGHSAAVLTDGVLQNARPMQAEGVRVWRDWQEIGFVPDLIHGQSVVDTMAALTRFPTVPVLYQCHGAGPLSAPPRHPRIYRFATMTGTLAQRLVIEFGIPESAIDVVPNSVDLTRFRTVREPPTKPIRALFYNSYHRPGGRTFEAIREAVEASGLQFECIGRPFQNTIDHPEHVLPAYDIVFAAGRSAIEALACGCAVIVLSMTSCGDMVRNENFDRLRRANFVIPFNSLPPSAHRIAEEIARYRAEDCAAVAAQVRRQSDATKMIDQIEEIYAAVIARHLAAPRDPQADQAATARFLRGIAPLVRLIDEMRSHGRIPLQRGAASRFAFAQISSVAGD